LRVSQDDKPKPAEFPSVDPMHFLFPLFNSYAEPSRLLSATDPRLNPILAPIETLPKNILFIIPTMDILYDEQIRFFDRLERDIAAYEANKSKSPDISQTSDSGSGEFLSISKPKSSYKVEALIFKGQFHGWLERELDRPKYDTKLTFTVPSFAIDGKTKEDAFRAASTFISDIHHEHGWFK
jgi:hypothetical protein